MDLLRLVFLLPILGVVMTQANEDDAKLRFYYSSMDHFIELSLDEASNVFATDWYDKGKNTIVFAHGFTGRPTGPAVTAIINAYIENGHYNVILLNWEHLAASRPQNIARSYLNWAAPNARMLGNKVADVLSGMFSSGLDINTTHFIGHSLGAQIFGIAGNNLAKEGIHVAWITGLDPASVNFENKPLAVRLHAGSALFVDIVHSDPSKYGYKRAHGTVDYWPNYTIRGPVRQPGCDDKNHPMFSLGDLCSHNRSWQLWIDALKYPDTILGSYAKNYRTWKNYSPAEMNTTTLAVGKYGKEAKPGDYFFVTNDESPYGLGEDGFCGKERSILSNLFKNSA